ncbi:MAG: hypothetical protein QOE56_1881 [Solirubrobacterales bacterium]|jgi:hypothetical protein|nr:hypothetical protein [Solirubrobacterales bacterium]
MLGWLRPRASGLLTAVGVALLAVFLMPAGAAALSGPQLLTFGEYATGTEISTQYEGQGVIFKDEFGFYPEVRWDLSASTNPVLSGTFGFGSAISAQFVAPGTTTPAPVENLSMDVGYIDEPESTQLVVNRVAGPSAIFADEYGFNHLSASGGGITGFQLETVGEEPEGFELDNLGFTVPAPPPPPPPPPAAPSCSKFLIYDSRGSGEKQAVLSKPGSDFLFGFLQRLHSLKNGSSVAQELNPYKAVGVFAFNKDIINGLGAVLHAGVIGDYWKSVRSGEGALEQFIERQISSPCGRSGATKIILLGYSQGAQVTGNVYEDLYPHLAKSEQAQIAAVVLWGDPRYNPLDFKANQDNRFRVGLLGPRSKFPDPGKVFSYCNTHDPICQEPLPRDQIVHYRGKEHSLYWTTDQAKNNGSALASFLVKGH